MSQSWKRTCWLLSAIILCAARPALADNWVGRAVMPKSDTTLLLAGRQVVGSVTDIHWPATVKKTNGTWLWVEDDGSTSHPRAAGWLRDDDVVPLNLALDYFNDRLLDGADDGGMYWLRGICWESQANYHLAGLDYDTAVKKSPEHPHAHLGLARALAKTSSDLKSIQARFTAAKRVNPLHPRLHWDWGQALEAADREKAKEHYTTATTLSPHWWQPYYSLGVLAGNQGDYATLIDQLGEALRRNPWSYHAYRDRAKFQLAEIEKKTPNPSAADLTAALASASKACELCYYRNCESMEVMASIFASMKNYDAAKRFQQMAVEQAPLPDKLKHVNKWHEYDDAAYRMLAANSAATPGPANASSATPPNNQVASSDDQPAERVRGRSPPERSRELLGPGTAPAPSESSGPAASAPAQTLPAPATFPAPVRERPVFIDRSGFSIP